MTATSRVGGGNERKRGGDGGMPTPRLQRYEHLKEVDEALRGALVLADLKMHENRAPPAWLADSSPDGPGLTESRVLEALVVEARRLQAWLPPHPDWPPSRTSPCSVCAWYPNTPPPGAPASAVSPQGV